jgi:ubiquinone/menaquinone biosynthesis C-methylase UbiE
MHPLARLYNSSVPLERDALRLALELADVRRGERLLDVGTGTGALLRALARSDAAPAQVIGIDRSLAMLSGASGLPPAWSLVVADATELPFADATFDVITISYVLHLLGPLERGRVLEAVRCAMRAGGRIVTVTVDSEHPVLRRVLEVLPAWTGLRRLDPRPAMVAAGFLPIQARFARTGWPSLCVLGTRV